MKRTVLFICVAIYLTLLPNTAQGQSATASLRGVVMDATRAVVPGAEVTLSSTDTALQRIVRTDSNGEFSFQELFVGDYRVEVRSQGFATWVNSRIHLDVGNQSQIVVQLVASAGQETVEVNAEGAGLETHEMAQGAVVSEREIANLPLNGRSFAQLGILQPGVRPTSASLMVMGTFRRNGQNYEVNGQRPESNTFLVDGMRNINRMDGGYAYRPPADSIAEFRILTTTAPAEFGGTNGGITTIVTRSGTNKFHGTVYEFLRNDVLNANNYFAPKKEAVRQNQFGGTIGGPLVQNHAYFFTYYEGLRNTQDITHGVIVPTMAERKGDFSADAPILLNGSLKPFGNDLSGQISPITARYLAMFPVPNSAQDPHLAQSTNPSDYNSDQGGIKADWLPRNADVLSARYSYSTMELISPYSELGADSPGFPVGYYTNTHLGGLTETHTFSANTVLTANASFFQNHIVLDKRLSGYSPQAFGFGYTSTWPSATGAPLIMTQGYSNVGDPIINPRDTIQNDYAYMANLAHTQGKHVMSFGAQFRRTQLNGYQSNFASGTFSFTVQGYTNNALANFLLGHPDIFTQAGGDFTRALRGWELGSYAQDEYRISPKLTLNYGVRYEITTPFNDIHNRLMAFAPGKQSSVYPQAPTGLLFPGDSGIPNTIAPIFKGDFAPRVGFAWDPRGNGRTVIRSAYGIFYDCLLNGVGMPMRAASNALPQTVVRTLTGYTKINYANPLGAVSDPFAPGQIALPASTFTIDRNLLPPYTQDWNLTVDQTLGNQVLSIGYIGAKGTRLPRLVEANPAIYEPGATFANSPRRRLYSGCTLTSGTCTLGTAGLVEGNANSTFHSAQASITRRGAKDLNYTFSYTFSKDLDYISSLHMSGPAPWLVLGELDIAQNNQNLKAEHGRSLFDARHRIAASLTYAVPFARSLTGPSRILLDGWQFNALLAANTSTPFTVYDSANVSLQAPHPGVSGMFGDRPNVTGNPNKRAPHKISEWVSRSAFQRLDPVANAGQFGNLGRNSVNGPAFGSLDASLDKSFMLGETAKVQLRVEAFNVTNHLNLISPVFDLNSPVFGEVTEAQAPRVIQLALKFQW
ncbi:TonB-dependent receptor [Occallatibacter riparius]|uniref:Carboxypeptidase regulatory-like domain-containing protein n=1 Tax=Occallatibacter riparius TaxID=1002689 RepID=A0A9J7BNQ9_9BACT|nr:carboxypeptidase regulatory-like domain-containing protein [Occallatibacter riparius]UWZ82797.1 carboxypeptidase regulatory-like domain-containing protein [Occallatibacter riparius]